LPIKKTPEPAGLIADRMQLQDGYEALRAYALSMVKTPSRPLGLDMWNKKGFLTWAAASCRRAAPPAPTMRVAAGHLGAPSALMMPLTNIIEDWSDRYGRPNDEWKNQT
jgi:hypothetical protein